LGFESERVDACVLLFARILLHRVVVRAVSCCESERVDACVRLLPHTLTTMCVSSYYYICVRAFSSYPTLSRTHMW
jgi:hypothetical protein